MGFRFMKKFIEKIIEKFMKRSHKNTKESERISLRTLRNSTFRIDLQLFARAEDEGRTEEPTAHKERKSREEGKVARSQELVSSLVLLFVLLGIWILGTYIMDSFKRMFYQSFQVLNQPFHLNNLNFYLGNALWHIARVALPIFLLAWVVAFLSNVIQVGFFFAGKAIKMDFKKVSFTTNKMFSKIFFSRQTLVNLVKSILKVAVILLVVYMFLDWKKFLLLGSINMEINQAFGFVTELAFYVSGVSALVFFVLSIPDYFFQKYEHRENLRMTRQELKEERKETEGDPHLKQRLRDRQREMMRRRMMEEVPKADVVITNPTHYAIALKYEAEKMTAPRVVAKGKDYIALRIRQIALENRVSLVENPELARSLFLAVEIGDDVPEEFYQAVAEVLAFVIRSREKIKV